MRHLCAAAAFLALGACGNPTDKSDDPTGEPAPVETMMPVEPDGGIGDGAGPPQDAAAVASDRIPARFQGVWDYEDGTCMRDSDMRMEVSGDEILFYESIGRVADVRSEGDDVVVTLDMEGEGETWTQETRFSLVGDGGDLRLHSSEGEKPKAKDEYPSRRCPD